MTIHVKPHLEAVLKAQVDAGRFPNVEEALEAAILSLEDDFDEDPADEDLEWMKPFIEEAEAEVAAGKTLSHEEVWAELKRRRDSRRAAK